MKALIVDDSRTMRTILGRVISQLGFEVEQAENGKTAWARLGAGVPPELVLVDWHMPEMTGPELVALMRADARFEHVFVIMVSSEGDPAMIGEALATGANEYIVKPFDAGAVAEKLALVGLGAGGLDSKVEMEWSMR
ncbi:MAG: response regulator [Actinomycetota bacterium]|nr:response regulator [Actinomycetota bacterium]